MLHPEILRSPLFRIPPPSSSTWPPVIVRPSSLVATPPSIAKMRKAGVEASLLRATVSRVARPIDRLWRAGVGERQRPEIRGQSDRLRRGEDALGVENNGVGAGTRWAVGRVGVRADVGPIDRGTKRADIERVGGRGDQVRRACLEGADIGDRTGVEPCCPAKRPAGRWSVRRQVPPHRWRGCRAAEPSCRSARRCPGADRVAGRRRSG